MDTISRENNNSMLPVGGIIVGVVALLLAGYAAMALSKINKGIADQNERIAKVESLEGQISSAAAEAAKANKGIIEYARQTQGGFDVVTGELTKLGAELAKMQEAKKPVVVAGKKGTEPAVAGANEYVVKSGDGGTKIATSQGVSLADLQAVNPGVDWRNLKIGQKIKLPAKR